MLNQALNTLKSSLNSHFNMTNPHSDSLEEKVVFPPGINADQPTMPANKVCLMLARIEQEKILRQQDLYKRTMENGRVQDTNPEIRLNLYVIFAANYSDYEDSLRNISSIIRYFQNHRLMTHDNTPNLDESLQQLVIELVTLSYTEQNELWMALRLPACPFVFYKITMVVYEADGIEAAPTQERHIEGLR